MPEFELINKTKVFLQSLQQGVFIDQEELALKELNILCQDLEIKKYLINEYFSDLAQSEDHLKHQLSYLCNATQKYSLPSLAENLLQSLIENYAIHTDESILFFIFEILQTYDFFSFISIENEGRSIRFESSTRSFVIDYQKLHADFRLRLLRHALVKYTNILTDNDNFPNGQEIQAIIFRLNNVLTLISNLSKYELTKQPLFTAFFYSKDISYNQSNSERLLGKPSFTEIEYDHLLFEQYQIPLFPIINRDKVNFDGSKISFQNEGRGSLPPINIRIIVEDEEFELIEYLGIISHGQQKSLYIEENEIKALRNFLKSKKINADIKISFIFHKFNHSYEYVVLNESVGYWLDLLPKALDIDLVISHELPFFQLSSKDFERLCYWVVEDSLTSNNTQRFHRIHWLGEDGGGERGKDIIAYEVGSGKKFVFQCKREEKFPPNRIKKVLREFADYIKNGLVEKPDVYILIIASSLTNETFNQGQLIASEIGMEFDCWPKSKLDRLVRTNDKTRQNFWNIIQK